MKELFNKSDIYEIEIEKTAFLGKGLGTIKNPLGDYRVFVPSTLPGDIVKARLVKIKKKYAEAEIVEFVKKSPLRIPPKCKHFGYCGGCNFQHLDYANQLKIKEEHVRDSFLSIARLKDAPIKNVIASKNEFYYRNKLEFSFGDIKEGDFNLGFHPKGRKFDVFMLEECFLQAKESYSIVKAIYDFFKEKKVALYKFKTRSGVLRSLFIRHSKSFDLFQINLEINDSDCPWMQDFIACCKQFSKISSVYLTKVITKKGERTSRIPQHIFGEKFLPEKMMIGKDTFNFQIAPDSFFQTNTFQAAVLYEEIQKAALSVISKQKDISAVYDLYCGTGTIGLALAKIFPRVYGFEISSSAIIDAKENALLNKINNIEFIEGDVKNTLGKIKEQPQIIVVDPPRAGIAKKVLEFLLTLPLKAIIYVSCNPPTLARDTEIILKNGFGLKSVQPIDMFPQTYHIESVALFTRD